LDPRVCRPAKRNLLPSSRIIYIYIINNSSRSESSVWLGILDETLGGVSEAWDGKVRRNYVLASDKVAVAESQSACLSKFNA
jgi:hypothetical protein